jgi:uncharacterized protein YbjT (DUF2867 family)
MSSKKIIAVAGATGAQGGGLVRAILEDRDGGFAARALVRDPQSDKAKELARQGAEVVTADIDDEASLTRALQGAHGAYFVTFFWAHFSPDKEKTEARNMARAAKAAGVKHVIWSTLEDTRQWIPLSDDRMPTLMGAYKVPHFDAKGESNQEFAGAGVPTTYMLTSGYWENFIHFGMGPKRGADGKLAIAFPTGDRKIPWIGAEDIGRCAYGIFKEGSATIGKTIGVSGEHLSGEELAQGFSKALGESVQYAAVTPAQYRAFGFPGADDLGNMWQFKRDFNDYYRGARNIEVARRLNPRLQDFDTWLAANKARIPLE